MNVKQAADISTRKPTLEKEALVSIGFPLHHPSLWQLSAKMSSPMIFQSKHLFV
jgi:hypothetical protein